MTGEELFEKWRECGAAYWGELSPAAQRQWEAVARAANEHADDKFKEGYHEGHQGGWSEGYDQGYDDGYVAGEDGE